MSFVTISNETFQEFKNLLEDNDINENTIRINLAGMSCGGPSFNIVMDEKKESDLSCAVNDITFIVNEDLYNKFGDFIIEGTAENNRGLILKPVNAPTGGCGSCGGGCS